MTTSLQKATILPDLTVFLALAVLGWIGYRLVLIAAFPWAPCRGCQGRGRFFRGENWRPCRRCKGSGRRIRLGRRIWHWATSGDRT